MADLKTARWGRPSVGTIGGKITGDDDDVDVDDDDMVGFPFSGSPTHLLLEVTFQL